LNKFTYNINCDLGEGFGNDALLMPLISSCNIACGGHYGNSETIKKTIQLAKNHQVKVGAHPSFPDPSNFGRKIMNISDTALAKSVFDQVQLFLSVCQSENIEMHHVKLHGAFYNLAAKDERIARIVIDTLKNLNQSFSIYAPPNSVLEKIGATHFNMIGEAFIDRRYNEDLSLVSRTEKKALIESSEESWKQFYEIAFKQQVTSITGVISPIEAQTYCIHGDMENAISILHYIHKQLNNA